MTDHHYDLIKKTIRIILIVFFMYFLLSFCSRSVIRRFPAALTVRKCPGNIMTIPWNILILTHCCTCT